MKSTLFIQLKPGKDAPVKRFHPWVFSGAIAKQSPNLQDGDWVSVYSSRDEFLGTGHYHNGSIAVKIISFQEIESKSAFWEKRIQNAWIFVHFCLWKKPMPFASFMGRAMVVRV